MPISLRVIERKLYRQDFADLRELESWLRRMISNVKDYYSNNKSSQTFEDAERVRKAISNWFVKYNPAYKQNKNHTQAPVPISPEYDVDAEIAMEDMDSETAFAEMGSRPARPRPVYQATPEVEDDTMVDADGDADADADADADEDDNQDAEGDEAEVEDSRASGTRIVLRRGGGAPASARETETPSTTGNMEGAQYSGVPYQGLTFQKAQEKILDTLMKRMDPEE